MTHSVDLYWSFRSPYSYIVVPKLIELERDWDAQVNVRPVLPIAVRQPDFFAQADPLWFSYLMRDCVRSAEFAGLPLRWPRPDPVVMDYATRTYPKEQPYIHRLTRLGVLAAEAGQGLALLRAVSHLIWSGETEGWHEGDHLARAVASAGLDLAELDARQEAEAERLDAVIKANEADQRLGGHYGVPLMVYQGEPFFGQDRYDQLVWRMQQNGMTARS
ncbi:DsbA family protein [Novosphingobium sp.]|uniref:2-hydroxychromene-2-carboxylate isomerase n=1 Tax=Novosphingobium sp. TaxID=1874826 RepID=UPI0022C38070|nr:DsbA family protein [Novosphingobium sp.]MCZ8018211.1 DsbA family protein [Novosphingobium sp.]MCZ8033205.1 DsbA family protein [Novosphingobium sp.]MCZ8051660.1 DsbA family protein [Novosphingobium sp.]MCZ8060202.1 DsbA family protein [Novosphingobium sp.]MCZ8231844.1 DsbA family protein [Novosphingobium sp.]